MDILFRQLLTGLILAVSSITGVAQQNDHDSWKQWYTEGFLEDENSPLDSAGITLLQFYPYDTGWVVEADFSYSSDGSVFIMPTSNGRQKEYVRYGTATFVLNGISMQLTVFQSLKLREIPEYADYVFIPFNDDTNGTETYGGGRYLDLRFADVEDHKLTIDFNRSYNPYCAYSDGYSCPVPPNENRLPVKVQAGEMLYGGMVPEH